MVQSILIGLVTLACGALMLPKLAMAIRRPSPGGAILLTSMFYLVGATIVYWREQTDMALLVYTVCITLFVIYVLSFSILSAALQLQEIPRPPEVPSTQTGSSGIVKWAFFLCMFSLGSWIVYIIGAEKLLAALYQFTIGNELDNSVLELRLSIYTGEDRWIAPGYVKQLRDIVLPLAVLILLFTQKRSGARFLLLASLVIPAVALLMMSSGERGPLLLFLTAAVYAASQAGITGLQRMSVSMIPLLLIIAVGAAGFTVLSSSFVSRSYEDTSAAVILADRVITRMPEENIHGAPVWTKGAPFPGAGWLSELGTVLPGTQQSLSNLIHEHLGGGDRGNSVLGMWTDVFYNFGFWLGLAIANLLGFLVAIFNHWVNKSRQLSTSANVCGLWLSICMMMVVSPFGFLLYGPFVLSVVLLLLTIIARVQRHVKSGSTRFVHETVGRAS
jgi:hypothetical protein